MGDSTQAWNEVEQHFAAWGRRVSRRYHEAGQTKDEASDAEEKRKVEEAVRQVVDELGRAFSAVGDTLKDDEAKRELKDAVSALGVAVGATVSDAGDAIRRQARPSAEPGPKPEAPRPDVPPADAPPTEE